MTQPWTVGVEQEFFLVDPETRHPVPLAEEVAEHAGDELDVQRELTPFQIEVATPVCRTSEELYDQVLLGRTHLAKAAHAAGCRLMASAVPPLGTAGPPPNTDEPRYRRMQYSHRKLLGGQGVCGMHVHVGVPDRETAVRVSNALRMWLPTLLALSANSPIEQAGDTGYASWRSIVWSRWPVGGPPPHLDSAEHYDRLVTTLVDTGVLLDPGMVYWDIRPSAHVPTVEIRVSDIPLTSRDAVVIAEIVRAFARTAAEEGEPEPVDDVLLRGAYWRAARDGVDGLGIDPRTGGLVQARELAAELVGRGSAALRDAGVLAEVEARLEWLRGHGSGAARQRRALGAAADARELVDMVLTETIADDR
ncbi:carboxylate-amine ligase [Saccharothrix coeruleofusca]|uniref:Putative glutamate--cysteine ligase 2 n=1 Tax=Saccharothrix coeruleofusca TaxID=33919 RepID=A0A918EEA5_9PSEU|nr:glutamate--cysteine ligase [Saccharothrix coeruleofusca]MBP2338012.1 carboxylate-amine ligase [Saccharothrix coeruleofusca]GGP63748.1 putative glutamate--cysteine ligase 2-3 [Saccharothrix coeruleofusca]